MRNYGVEPSPIRRARADKTGGPLGDRVLVLLWLLLINVERRYLQDEAKRNWRMFRISSTGGSEVDKKKPVAKFDANKTKLMRSDGWEVKVLKFLAARHLPQNRADSDKSRLNDSERTRYRIYNSKCVGDRIAVIKLRIQKVKKGDVVG